jgi:hypothetical protein
MSPKPLILVLLILLAVPIHLQDSKNQFLEDAKEAFTDDDDSDIGLTFEEIVITKG